MRRLSSMHLPSWLQVLPLDPGKLTNLAVLGPYANQPGYIMG